MGNKNQERIHKLLIGFATYNQNDIRPSIANCRQLFEKFAGCNNPVVVVLLSKTVTQVLETVCLRLHEGWLLLNQELKRLGEPTFPDSDADFESLDRLRNKFIGHRVANSLNSHHLAWYNSTFGSFEKTYEFLQKVADRIETRIDELVETGKFQTNSGVGVNKVNDFSNDDLDSLVNALKKGDVW